MRQWHLQMRQQRNNYDFSEPHLRVWLVLYVDMKIIEDIVRLEDLNNVIMPGDGFYLDIETTGLSARTSQIYLIGVVFMDGGVIKYRQWFAEGLADEQEMIREFLLFAGRFNKVLHFNGNTFDIPFIRKCASNYHLKYPENLQSVDLMLCLKRYAALLNMTSLKQKAFEERLGIKRDDEYSGAELIDVYKAYVINPDETELDKLLLHNHDDLYGMLELSRALTYESFMDCPIKITEVNVSDELTIRAECEGVVFPSRAEYRSAELYLLLEDSSVLLSVPVTDRGVKYYFDDYKNYYYLPEEDAAIHESIGSFVDSSHRKRATFDTCYQHVNASLIKDEKQALKYLKMMYSHFMKTKHK
ncbi:MAG: ribonuclease H-like domain-containing protein [Lachnospiraceae bacterium]|nr:ribonuclease H-like domain-containing protein [Lachnospiraceae bacterium]